MTENTIPAHWRQHTFRAMGCRMTLWLEMDKAQTAERVLAEAETMFRSAESVLSRFDAASELSWLNGCDGRWTPVSELMWSVITRAFFMAEETDGLFDPTQLGALEAAGYDRSFNEMSPDLFAVSEDRPLNRRGQWRDVLLDAGTRAIWLLPNVRLDLGGIAKGHTAQRVVDFLNERGPCLVDAGGDLTAGAAPLDLPGWPLSVAAPYAAADLPRTDLFQLWLVNGSMATSGIDYRRWRRNGRSAHHEIDPRTGQPAETDLLTVTVLAKAATRAEAWATAALVAGSDTADVKIYYEEPQSSGAAFPWLEAELERVMEHGFFDNGDNDD